MPVVRQPGTAGPLGPCIWHGDERCRSAVCGNPRFQFTCPAHGIVDCAKCTTILEWAVRRIKRDFREPIEVSTCQGHYPNMACENWFCDMCLTCVPDHKHSLSLPADVGKHIGSKFRIRRSSVKDRGMWHVGTMPSTNESVTCKTVVEQVEGYIDEIENFTEDDASRSVSFMPPDEVSANKAWLMRSHPAIFGKSFTHLRDYVLAREPSGGRLTVTVTALIAQLLADRSPPSDEVARMTNFVSMDKSSHQVTFDVPKSRDFHRRKPEYMMIALPSDLVHSKDGKPIVRILMPNDKAPSWVYLSDLEVGHCGTTAMAVPLAHLKFKTTLFRAIAPSSIPFKVKMSLLTDFKDLGPNFLTNCMWFSQGCTKSLQRHAKMPVDIRCKFTDQASVYLPILDYIRNIRDIPRDASRKMVQNRKQNLSKYVQEIVQHWRVSLDSLSIFTEGHMGRICSDLFEQAYGLLVYLSDGNPVGLEPHLHDEAVIDVTQILKRVEKKVDWYIFSQRPGARNRSFVTMTGNVNRTMPDWATTTIMHDDREDLSLPLCHSASQPLPIRGAGRRVPLSHLNTATTSGQQVHVEPNLILHDVECEDWSDSDFPDDVKQTSLQNTDLGQQQFFPIYSCYPCGFSTTEYEEYDSHKRQCDSIKFCAMCYKMLPEVTSRQRHLIYCSQIRIWRADDQCSHCHETFPSSAFYEDHLMERHYEEAMRSQQKSGIFAGSDADVDYHDVFMRDDDIPQFTDTDDELFASIVTPPVSMDTSAVDQTAMKTEKQHRKRSQSKSRKRTETHNVSFASTETRHGTDDSFDMSPKRPRPADIPDPDFQKAFLAQKERKLRWPGTSTVSGSMNVKTSKPSRDIDPVGMETDVPDVSTVTRLPRQSTDMTRQSNVEIVESRHIQRPRRERSGKLDVAPSGRDVTQMSDSLAKHSETKKPRPSAKPDKESKHLDTGKRSKTEGDEALQKENANLRCQIQQLTDQMEKMCRDKDKVTTHKSSTEKPDFPRGPWVSRETTRLKQAEEETRMRTELDNMWALRESLKKPHMAGQKRRSRSGPQKDVVASGPPSESDIAAEGASNRPLSEEKIIQDRGGYTTDADWDERGNFLSSTKIDDGSVVSMIEKDNLTNRDIIWTYGAGTVSDLYRAGYRVPARVAPIPAPRSKVTSSSRNEAPCSKSVGKDRVRVFRAPRDINEMLTQRNALLKDIQYYYQHGILPEEDNKRQRRRDDHVSGRGTRGRFRYKGHYGRRRNNARPAGSDPSSDGDDSDDRGRRGHYSSRNRRRKLSSSSSDSSLDENTVTDVICDATSLNRYANQSCMAALKETVAGNEEKAKLIIDVTESRLRGADKFLRDNVAFAEGVTVDMIIEEIGYDCARFGREKLRYPIFQDLDNWNPDQNETRGERSERLTVWCSQFLQRCYTNRCSERDALTVIEMKMGTQPSAVMSEWKRETQSGELRRRVTLFQFIYQLFSIYYRPDPTYSEHWLTTAELGPHDHFQPLFYRIRKHVRIAVPPPVIQSGQKVRDLWIESRLISEVDKRTTETQKIYLNMQNKFRKDMSKAPMSALDMCLHLDSLTDHRVEPRERFRKFDAGDDQTQLMNSFAQGQKRRVPPAINSTNRRGRKWTRQKFDEPQDQTDLLESERLRRLNDTDCDSSWELESDVEELLDLQERLIEETVSPEDRHDFIRKYQLRRESDFKDYSKLIGVLHKSCFRCGSLRHQASGCPHFKDVLLTSKKCAKCGQGSHLDGDLTEGSAKDCVALRAVTRADNRQYMKENPDYRSEGGLFRPPKPLPFRKTPKRQQTQQQSTTVVRTLIVDRPNQKQSDSAEEE